MYNKSYFNRSCLGGAAELHKNQHRQIRCPSDRCGQSSPEIKTGSEDGFW